MMRARAAVHSVWENPTGFSAGLRGELYRRAVLLRRSQDLTTDHNWFDLDNLWHLGNDCLSEAKLAY